MHVRLQVGVCRAVCGSGQVAERVGELIVILVVGQAGSICYVSDFGSYSLYRLHLTALQQLTHPKSNTFKGSE